MFDFDKFKKSIESLQSEFTENHTTEVVSSVIQLIHSTNTAEALRAGLNSVTIHEIDYLFESVCYYCSVEEDADDERSNVFSPLGEYLSNVELLDMLVGTKPNKQPVAIF